MAAAAQISCGRFLCGAVGVTSGRRSGILTPILRAGMQHRCMPARRPFQQPDPAARSSSHGNDQQSRLSRTTDWFSL